MPSRITSDTDASLQPYQFSERFPPESARMKSCTTCRSHSRAIGMQMKNLQPFAIYHAADLELAALPIEACKPAGVVQSLDQGLDADRDAGAIRGHRLCSAISGVAVQEKVLTIQPAD